MESTYASGFQIFSNIYDFKIVFAELEPKLDEKGDVVGQASVLKERIVMSPILAKDLARKLSAAVEDYENKFGKTPVLNKEDSQ